MNDSHTTTLITLTRRRLHILEEQRAALGPNHVPPHVIIEIEQAQEQLIALERQLQTGLLRDHVLETDRPRAMRGLILLVSNRPTAADPQAQSAQDAIDASR